MEKKERVLKAIRLEEPDRVPIGEILINDPIVSKVLGYDIVKLTKVLMNEKDFIMTLPGWREWYNVPAIIGDPIRTKYFSVLMIKAAAELGLDMIQAGFTPGYIDKIIDPITFIDNRGCKWKLSLDGFGGVIPFYVGGTLKTSEDVEKLRIEFSDPRWVETLEWILKQVKGYDIYVVGSVGPGIYEVAMQGVGHSEFFPAIYRNRTFIEEIMDAHLKVVMEWIKIQLDLGFEFIFYFDDQAYKSGPFLNPKLWKKLVYPRIKQITDLVHKRGSLIGIHTDGNVWLLMESLVELFDLIHPLEPPMMDLAGMKEKYGNKICLMGNVDVHHLLPHGTPEEIAEHTKKCIEIAAPGGGYICSSSHSLNPAVKYDNAVNYINTVKKYGKYPLEN